MLQNSGREQEIALLAAAELAAGRTAANVNPDDVQARATTLKHFLTLGNMREVAMHPEALALSPSGLLKLKSGMIGSYDPLTKETRYEKSPLSAYLSFAQYGLFGLKK